MSTFIPVNWDEAVEPQAAPSGRYDLQITGCDVAKTGPNSKHPGSPQYKVSIGFVGQENVPNITQFISLPHEADEPKSANFKVLLLKRFLHLFGIRQPEGGIDVEQLAMEMVGAEVRDAEVKQDEPDANGNIYNRLVVPRLPAEGDDRGFSRR